MNIVLKEKEIYKEATNINSETYSSNDLIYKRFINIFVSFSRILRSRKSLDKTKKDKELKQLFTFVKVNIIDELIKNHEKILQSQTGFNKWHENKINSLIENCPITWGKGKQLTIGMAQKIINLTCKDLWALGYIPEKKSRLFHVVVDQSTVEIIQRYIKKVQPWTLINSYKIYMEYQKLFKIISINPLVLENIIWHTFSKKSSTKKG